jgi:hypothetical protein
VKIKVGVDDEGLESGSWRCGHKAEMRMREGQGTARPGTTGEEREGALERPLGRDKRVV